MLMGNGQFCRVVCDLSTRGNTGTHIRHSAVRRSQLTYAKLS